MRWIPGAQLQKVFGREGDPSLTQIKWTSVHSAIEELLFSTYSTDWDVWWPRFGLCLVPPGSSQGGPLRWQWWELEVATHAWCGDRRAFEQWFEVEVMYRDWLRRLKSGCCVLSRTSWGYLGAQPGQSSGSKQVNELQHAALIEMSSWLPWPPPDRILQQQKPGLQSHWYALCKRLFKKKVGSTFSSHSMDPSKEDNWRETFEVSYVLGKRSAHKPEFE